MMWVGIEESLGMNGLKIQMNPTFARLVAEWERGGWVLTELC